MNDPFHHIDKVGIETLTGSTGSEVLETDDKGALPCSRSNVFFLVTEEGGHVSWPNKSGYFPGQGTNLDIDAHPPRFAFMRDVASSYLNALQTHVIGSGRNDSEKNVSGEEQRKEMSSALSAKL